MCHQTVSLIARYLEENNVPTVVMGCARDIVENAGVPRFLWSDFPLGNSAGKPFDVDSQSATLELALGLFETARNSGHTLVSEQRWSDNDDWQLDFMNIDKLSDVQIDKLKADFLEQKRIANELKKKH